MMSLCKVVHNLNIISLGQDTCDEYNSQDCYSNPLPDEFSKSLNTCISAAHQPRQEEQPAQPSALPAVAASATIDDAVRENLRGRLSQLSSQVTPRIMT